MLARVDDRNGRAVTLHRTYLTRDGKKANVPTVKKLMSPTVPGGTCGGAIRIYPAGETLAITEGPRERACRALHDRSPGLGSDLRRGYGQSDYTA